MEDKKEIIIPKPSEEDIISNITAFLHSQPFEDMYEKYIEERIQIVEQLRELTSDGEITPDRLLKLIQKDTTAISSIISLLGMSQEEFYRVITLTRILDGNFDSEWKIEKIVNECRNNPVFGKKVAYLLINGKDDSTLQKHIPRFSLNKLDKRKLLLDKDALVDGLIRQGLKGKYDAQKGKIAEKAISEILDRLNVEYLEGEIDVPEVERKMDFVIPNVENPKVLIESGIFITTARELSEKGLVEMAIRRQVEENYPDTVIVRVTDGIGWIARGGNA